MAGHIIIEDFAILGGMCALHQFVRVGKHAFVSGGSLGGKDIPPYTVACRYPLSYGGINSVGLKRRGFSTERINTILDIYRVVYNNGMNLHKLWNILEREFPESAEKSEIVEFIKNSPRGIIRRYTQENEEEPNYQ